MGKQAALNIAIGRVDRNKKVLFDDSDEILYKKKIIFSDMTGAFRDCESPFEDFIAEYAKPIVTRKSFISDIDAAIDSYSNGFFEGFLSLQQHYYCNIEAMEKLPFKSRNNIDEFNLQKKWILALNRLGNEDVNKDRKSVV